MALTPEQARKVIELVLKRRIQGLPPLVPRRKDNAPPLNSSDRAHK